MIYTATPVKGGRFLCMLTTNAGNWLAYVGSAAERYVALDLLLNAAGLKPFGVNTKESNHGSN